jgi:hypothetical protein
LAGALPRALDASPTSREKSAPLCHHAPSPLPRASSPPKRTATPRCPHVFAPTQLIGYCGVRARPTGTFYSEIRNAGDRIVLGTFHTAEDAAHAYDTVVWRLERPRRDMNFRDCESLTETEFLASANNVIVEKRRRHL